MKRNDNRAGKGPGSRAAKDIKAIESEEKKAASWKLAQEHFPRTPFPWHILPPEISESLKRLARSCASSSDHLPGVALAILASCLGRAADVCPKEGWREPLILWICDIRPSGEGKTPTGRKLLKIVEHAQFEEHKRYKAAMEEYEDRLEQWKALPKKDREGTRPHPPSKERGYLITNLTLEGVHADLDDHPTGGIIVCQDELSSFVSGQNQYKTKGGNDRESWLVLHDGKSARIIRASKTITIVGARVSIFGGIQPGVFQKAFTDDGGVFLLDGTLFRFLVTYEQSAHRPLTGEEWAGKDREVWENLLGSSLDWADEQIDQKTGEIETFRMFLDTEAQARFFDWRNSIDKVKADLHPALQGFIPKAVGYAARLTGLLHALWHFHQGKNPKKFLTLTEVDRGIEMMGFYLGQTVDAMRLIEDVDHQPPDTSERVKHLAEVLEALRQEVDSGRLAVGHIHARFNDGLPKEKQIGTAKAMGALLRSIPLAMCDGLHDANGRRGVSCLEWNEKTQSFLKQSLQSLQSLQTLSGQCFGDADIEKTKSAKSARLGGDGEDMQTLQTLKKQSLQPEGSHQPIPADLADFADVISDNFEKFDSDGPAEELPDDAEAF